MSSILPTLGRDVSIDIGSIQRASWVGREEPL